MPLIDSTDRFDGTVDAIEGALAKAIEGATSAGRFDVVVCKNSIEHKLRGLPVIVIQDASQPLAATNDAFA